MSATVRTRSIATLAGILLAVAGLAACGSGSTSSSGDSTGERGELTVTDAWARASAASSEFGAVYLTIENATGTDDALTGVSVPTSVAADVQVHETVAASAGTASGEGSMQGQGAMGGDGMMTMQEVPSVTVPAGSTVAFEPGGHHVMLMGLTGPLEVGQSIPLTLTFAEAGEITVPATVRAS